MKMRKLISTAIIGTMTLIGASSAAMAYDGEYFRVCRLNPQGDNFLALRTCGASKCQMLLKLLPNKYLITTEPYAVNRWREVIVLDSLHDREFSGETGWVYNKYICPVR